MAYRGGKQVNVQVGGIGERSSNEIKNNVTVTTEVGDAGDSSASGGQHSVAEIRDTKDRAWTCP